MMLLCKDCDYYESADNPDEKELQELFACLKNGACSYSGFVFIDDPDDLEAEYPCNQKKQELFHYPVPI